MDAEANSYNIRLAEQARAENILSLKSFQSLEVIKWLNPADSEYYFEIVNQCREKDTGEWFKKSAEVSSWLKGDGPLLWINGIPG